MTFDVEGFRNRIKERNKINSKVSEMIQKDGEKFIFEMSKDLFTKYPKMESFGWNQGQYYNDENYYFSVNNDCESVMINGDNEREEDWMNQAADDIETLMMDFNDEDMNELFGEATIEITKGGVTHKDFDTGC